MSCCRPSWFRAALIIFLAALLTAVGLTFSPGPVMVQPLLGANIPDTSEAPLIMKTSSTDAGKNPAIPPLDAAPPGRLETATFALG